MSADFIEHRIAAPDGLTLYLRDYNPEARGRVPAFCVPGLTRNSKDFAALAEILSPQRRVLCIDLRGRGRSDYDPNHANYAVAVELTDCLHVLTALGVPQVALVGTSRGGLIAVAMAAFAPHVLKGVVLNDIGPDLAPEGIARILSYVGKQAEPASWPEAIAAVRALNAPMFDLDEAGWERFARTIFRDEGGRPRLDYDPKIGDAIRASVENAGRKDAPPQPDPWQLFRALSSIPTLLIQGANSDLLTDAIVAKMTAAKPDLELCKVPGRGHAPFLDEPQAVSAITAFLARCDQ